jgi:hypothetical protein
MRAFLQALFASLFEWLGVQAERGKRASDAQDDRSGQQRIGRRIEEHLRARRDAAADTYGGVRLREDGTRERGQPDQDGT